MVFTEVVIAQEEYYLENFARRHTHNIEHVPPPFWEGDLRAPYAYVCTLIFCCVVISHFLVI